LLAAAGSPPDGEVWIGDDAAVVAGPPTLLLAADLVVEGVHADLTLTGIDDFGWKAIAVNVSDLAAMGGRPLHALVTVAGPPGTDLDRLYAGIADAAREYQCAVVGGDLANADQLVLSVAVTGTTDGGRPVLRGGARPGDQLFVTGPLGAAAAGLRELRAGVANRPASQAPIGASQASSANIAAHARPRALPAEGAAARRAGASAMIDVSDGLAADLGHVAEQSGVGLALRRDDIPVALGATFEEALAGGEDYQLAFAAPDPEAVVREFRTAGLAPPAPIGVCTANAGERSLDGTPWPATRLGWEHQW
jgi:thiamine-monophosphate kinase